MDHEFLMNLFHHNLFAVLDIDALLCGLALDAAAAEVVGALGWGGAVLHADGLMSFTSPSTAVLPSVGTKLT